MMTAGLDAQGEPGEFRFVLRDISPAKEAEEALRAMKNYSDSLPDTVEAVVLLIDADGHILRSNAYARMISGRGPEALLGRDWCDVLIPEAERHAARGMVHRALAGGAARSGVLALTALDLPE